MLHQQRLTSPEENAMDEQYLICRSAGHVFLEFTDFEIVERRGKLVSYKQESVCLRCTTERVQHIDGGTFAIISNTYKYPKGYLSAPGERITRRDARRALWK